MVCMASVSTAAGGAKAPSAKRRLVRGSVQATELCALLADTFRCVAHCQHTAHCLLEQQAGTRKQCVRGHCRRSVTGPCFVACLVSSQQVLWFRNDLRLTDNYIVHEAVQSVTSQTYQEASHVTYTHRHTHTGLHSASSPTLAPYSEPLSSGSQAPKLVTARGKVYVGMCLPCRFCLCTFSTLVSSLSAPGASPRQACTGRSSCCGQ